MSRISFVFPVILAGNPSNEPADPRFNQLKKSMLIGHGEAKFGLYAKDVDQVDEGKTTMEQWRKKWGFR